MRSQAEELNAINEKRARLQAQINELAVYENKAEFQKIYFRDL